MLLLYLVAMSQRKGERLIYIPLCFYFILVIFYAKKLIFRIYIPLCFYFIKILINYPELKPQFTFHYASTLSRLQLQIASADTHLHSTMLLLYHYPWKDSSYGEPEFTFHYASTLSSWMMLATAMTTKFTFHYASTLSGSLRRSLLSSLIYYNGLIN